MFLLGRFKVVPAIVELTGTNDDALIEYGTGVLANSATLYSGRVDIIENGGASILVQLMSHTEPRIQKNVLKVIWHLLEEPINYPPFCQPESLKLIMGHIDSEDPNIQILALSIIEKMSSSPLDLPYFDTMDDIIPLIGTVRMPKYTIQTL